ncbi:hypothetical protein ACFWOY_27825 [Streptomyces sp. NPDC058423]|uniref:hypothetical protein n=1 Tax=unclassified Streptomyces TaxID=2593676 RepID=UPI00364BAE8F
MAGGFAAAQYVHNVIEVGGLWFPTVRRAYLCDANGSPVQPNCWSRSTSATYNSKE